MQRNRIHRLGKEFSFTGAAQVVNGIGLLIVLKITASSLSPSEYGKLALILTISSLINKIGFGGLLNSVFRFYPVAEQDKKLDEFYQSIRIIVKKTAAGLSLIAILIIGALILANQSGWIVETVSLIIFAASSGLAALVMAINSAQRDRESILNFEVANYFLRITILWMLLKNMSPNAQTVIIGYSLASIGTAVFQIMQFKIKHKADLEFKHQASEHKHTNQLLEQLWGYAWPFTVWGFFTWFEESAGKWSLQTYFGPEEVGFFTIGFQLGVMPILLVSGTMNQFIEPVINRRLNKINETTVKALRRMIYNLSIGWVLVTAVAACVASNLSNSIYGLMADEEFLAGSYLLPFFVIIGGFQAIVRTSNLQLNALKLSRQRIGINISTALLSAATVFIGAKYAGLYGVIGGLYIGYAVKVVWNYHLAYQFSVANPNQKNISISLSSTN